MMSFSSAFENLGFKSLKIVISMWSLIRLCWVDIFPRINTHADMAIRATRVGENCKWVGIYKQYSHVASCKIYASLNFGIYNEY